MGRMRHTRRLRVNKSTLRALTSAEAAAAAGGKREQAPDGSRYCLPVGTKTQHHTNSPYDSRYCPDGEIG